MTRVRRTHPCINQFGSCLFGDQCAFRDYPGDICVLHLQGNCSNIGCRRSHNETYLTRRSTRAHSVQRCTVTKHPCVYQFGSCQFGDDCKLKEYPGNICVLFLQGKCRSRCDRYHNAEYLSQKVYLKLVVDCSGLMDPYFDTVVSSINSVTGALREDDRISVVAFSKTPQMVANLIPKEKFYNNQMLNKPINNERGHTALFDSIVFATGTLDKELQEICKQNKDPRDMNTKVIIGVVTDGMDNASKSHTRSSAARALSSSGAKVFVMGINVGGYAASTLKSLCPDPSNYIDRKGDPSEVIERALSTMQLAVVVNRTTAPNLIDWDEDLILSRMTSVVPQIFFTMRSDNRNNLTRVL